ncbi:O-methyltransferase [Ascochyta rabiei]|uniref:O-methyltransferase n=1 Tax=Didymella rabiei TaxID=5454 RepID=A0A163KXR1_DIDRA|nr:O-methyltransferase [Ascochyta rabiei]
MASPPRPLAILLAERIHEAVTRLEDFNSEHGHANLCLKAGSLPRPPLPANLQELVESALYSLDRLTALLSGPQEWLRLQYGRGLDLLSLHALYRYDIPRRIPKEGDISISELAVQCGVDEESFSRLIQHAVTRYHLVQPRPGHVAHSSVSALLASSQPQMDLLGMICEDYWPAFPRALDAIAKWPEPLHMRPPHHSGHNLAEGTDFDIFVTMKTDPKRSARFDNAMRAFQALPGWEAGSALEGFNWASLDSAATVVDVGGGDGTFARALAGRYPSLNTIIIQDSPDVVVRAKDLIPAELLTRVKAQAHDFFKPQPVQGADVYFLRKILHDWPDSAAVAILKQIVPAMKPSSRIILNEECVPAPGTLPNLKEWETRSRNMLLMAVNNGKERSEEEWKKLVEEADSRLVWKLLKRGETMAIMEITLKE